MTDLSRINNPLLNLSDFGMIYERDKNTSIGNRIGIVTVFQRMCVVTHLVRTLHCIKRTGWRQPLGSKM